MQKPRMSPRGFSADKALDYPPQRMDALFTVWSGNGLNWPEASRSVYYLSKTRTSIMKDAALICERPDEAVAFASREEAEAFLQDHEARRGQPYTGFRVGTFAELKVACGYDELIPEPDVAAEARVEAEVADPEPGRGLEM